jgi:transposase
LLGIVVYAGGMDGEIGTDAEAKRLVAAALTGQLTDVQSQALAELSPEVLSLALLAASRRIADQDGRISELEAKLKVATIGDPATPSGQKPLYTKPPRRKSKRKPGAKNGHAPAYRKTPQRIDRREDHRLDVCPDCGGPLQQCKRKRTRTIEDILEDMRTEVVEHTIHRDYCPACKKHVEPVAPDALPRAL